MTTRTQAAFCFFITLLLTLPAGVEPSATAAPGSGPSNLRSHASGMQSPAMAVEELVLQQGADGYDGTVDAYIDNAYPDENFGGRSWLMVHGGEIRSALVRFELLGHLPQGAIIHNATLEVYATTMWGQRPLDEFVGAFRVRRRWLEDETTWNVAAAGQPWAVPGCQDIILDRDPTADASVWVTDPERSYSFSVASMVQGWVDDPVSNHGLLLKAVSAGLPAEYAFLSSESGQAHRRPILRIQYTRRASPTNTPTPTRTPTRTPTPTTLALERVTDLAALPAATAGHVTLAWHAPHRYVSPQTNVWYDVRYSRTPINVWNWASAEQLTGEPAPAIAGAVQTMPVPELDLRTRWYFAMKTVAASHESELSNVPSVIDLEFRPMDWGYSFSNSDAQWRTGAILPDPELARSAVERTFGSECACIAAPWGCLLRLQAERWWRWTNACLDFSELFGVPYHCEGMAASSLLLFKGIDQLSDLSQGAIQTHDLSLTTKVRQNIQYYRVRGERPPVAALRADELPQDIADDHRPEPKYVPPKLFEAMSGRAENPYVLVAMDANSGRSHALVPYAVQEWDASHYWVWVYDSNDVNDSNRWIEIDAGANTWSYDMGDEFGVWQGNLPTRSLVLVPVRLYLDFPLDCPWGTGGGDAGSGFDRQASAGQTLEVWHAGAGHLVVMDMQGRRTGYWGGRFINEIPGARADFPVSLADEPEPIYRLPIADGYKLSLNGAGVTGQESGGVIQFGPGYAAWVEDVPISAATHDLVAIAPAGTRVAYTASQQKELTLGLALDSATYSYGLRTAKADVGAGQTLELRADTGMGWLALDNSVAGGGSYVLDITRVGQRGEQRFINYGVTILPGATHHADYGSWDGVGAMKLYVDHNSDGAIDATWHLENQLRRLYLPSILKRP